MCEFFPRLSITSVDGKQHLSEVVFSALVGIFTVREMTGFGLYPYTEDMLDSINRSPTSGTSYSLFTYSGLLNLEN